MCSADAYTSVQNYNKIRDKRKKSRLFALKGKEYPVLRVPYSLVAIILYKMKMFKKCVFFVTLALEAV